MTRLQKEINRFENHPVELLPFARKALNQMKHFRKFLITKGNEQEQRRKLKLSSMSNLFDEILIVNKKIPKKFGKYFLIEILHLTPRFSSVIVFSTIFCQR
jgi:FMN phosphatase YigB (HAD superfamily)